jgi:hypothetical protein
VHQPKLRPGVHYVSLDRFYADDVMTNFRRTSKRTRALAGFESMAGNQPPLNYFSFGPRVLLILPPWGVCTFAAVGLLLAGVRRSRRAGLCPTCGYDLRGTPGRCPECGRKSEELSAAP